MTDSEFDAAWHALDFTEIEWLEIGCLHSVFLDIAVLGQPFPGYVWKSILRELGHEVTSAENRIFGWRNDAEELRELIARLHEIGRRISTHMRDCRR